MAVEFFEVLGLPLEPVAPAELTKSYEKLREQWFFRQYEPEHLVEAKGMLDQIDNAYRQLKEPRRQEVLLREAKSERRHEKPQTVIRELDDTGTTTTKPTALNRSKVVRELVKVAEEIVKRTGRPVEPEERQILTRVAFREGLDYVDAEETVERIAEQVAEKFKIPSGKANRTS